MDFLLILLILSALYIGWNIGANDASNCLGSSVGAGILSYKSAGIFVAIFALIGAVVQGGNTISTVGKGIVDPVMLTNIDIIAGLLSASLLVTYFTFKGLPVSTTHAVIGSIAGIGLFKHLVINWSVIGQIFASWIATPLIAVIASILAYYLLSFLLKHQKFSFIEKRLKFLIVLSGLFFAYSLGANNVGNSVGLVVEKGIMGPLVGALVGGIAIGLGSVTFGGRVMKTIGTGITALDERMAFTAQLSAAMTLYLLTLLHVPSSSSHAIVGGVLGTGLVKGLATINKKELWMIARGWVLTPAIAAVLGIILLLGLQLVV